MRKVGGARGTPSQRMFSIARELLWRQRVIYPFPYDHEEVLLSLLPPVIQELAFGDGAHGEEATQWDNLTQCVTFGTAGVIDLGELSKGFWLLFTNPIPVPAGTGGTLVMHQSNPHWQGVYEWCERAAGTHQKLMGYEEGLHCFFERAHHPELVQRYWPELFAFVDFELAPNQGLSRKEREKRRVVPMPTHDAAVGIIDTLAGSTLLEPYKCTAWVGYEVEE